MLERLKNIETRYLEINNELSNPEVLSNIKETTKLSKEQALLKDAYNMYQEYKSLSKQIEDNKDLVKAKRKTKFIDCNRVLEQYNDKSINELEPDELDLLIIWLNEK